MIEFKRIKKWEKDNQIVLIDKRLRSYKLLNPTEVRLDIINDFILKYDGNVLPQEELEKSFLLNKVNFCITC
jgi:hypothetical protein